MEDITIGGLSENAFRSSIEAMLRNGQADGAAGKLRDLIAPYAGEGRILPSRFLTVTSDEIALVGWDELGTRLDRYDRPEQQISALSIAVADPEVVGVRPDEAGRLAPPIETSYFSDEAYPFSEAGRSDLLDGYSLYGCEWQGDCEDTDFSLSVAGIEDLYGAVARLEAKLLDSKAPSQDEIRAGSLGACYLSVLIHQAVRDSIRRSGLPRPLCIMAGNNGTYPFFDAPVMSAEEYLDDGSIHVEPDQVGAASIDGDGEATGEPAQEADYGSLLSLSVRPAKKKPVIALDPADAGPDIRLQTNGSERQPTIASPLLAVALNREVVEPEHEAAPLADTVPEPIETALPVPDIAVVSRDASPSDGPTPDDHDRQDVDADTGWSFEDDELRPVSSDVVDPVMAEAAEPESWRKYVPADDQDVDDVETVEPTIAARPVAPKPATAAPRNTFRTRVVHAPEFRGRFVERVIAWLQRFLGSK